MAAYMITYDLNKQGKDYKGVYDAIKESAINWCHYWDSAWLIKSNLTVQQIADNIKPHLDGDDRLIAIEVKQNYQGWMTEEQWKYIRENIFA
ncbi:MAG: hypothetical protein ACYDEJ_03450 [Desulfitobacteriaceae bacterium]